MLLNDGINLIVDTAIRVIIGKDSTIELFSKYRNNITQDSIMAKISSINLVKQIENNSINDFSRLVKFFEKTSLR